VERVVDLRVRQLDYSGQPRPGGSPKLTVTATAAATPSTASSHFHLDPNFPSHLCFSSVSSSAMTPAGGANHSPAPRSLVFAFYLTGHGFGHATRAIEVSQPVPPAVSLRALFRLPAPPTTRARSFPVQGLTSENFACICVAWLRGS
jgi:hypothetical protein